MVGNRRLTIADVVLIADGGSGLLHRRDSVHSCAVVMEEMPPIIVGTTCLASDIGEAQSLNDQFVLVASGPVQRCATAPVPITGKEEIRSRAAPIGMSVTVSTG